MDNANSFLSFLDSDSQCPFIQIHGPTFFYAPQEPTTAHQHTAVPLQDHVTPPQGPISPLQGSVVHQERRLIVNSGLASEDVQNLHPQGPGNTEHYSSHALLHSISSNPPALILETIPTLAQNDSRAEYLTNDLPVNTDPCPSTGSLAGPLHTSAPSLHSKTAGKLHPDYSSTPILNCSGSGSSKNNGYLHRNKSTIVGIENLGDDAFLSSGELSVQGGPTSLPSGQYPVPTGNPMSTVGQGSYAARETNPEVETQPGHAAASATPITSPSYPDGIFFAEPYDYYEGRTDRRKNNINHELERAKKREKESSNMC
ncbi:hypothetical protein EDD21DRAFT_75959 [Dissophora ornata]|nr:hypothetical protein EDD21DRAFT_75959 [Dissophora ornata]